jgi:hypothetical protein
MSIPSKETQLRVLKIPGRYLEGKQKAPWLFIGPSLTLVEGTLNHFQADAKPVIPTEQSPGFGVYLWWRARFWAALFET